MAGNRAQVFTLEGVLAALVILAGLLFALQAVVVTPGSTTGGNQAVDVEQVDSVLADTAESGALKRAVLSWSGGAFQGTRSESYFVGRYPSNDFGAALRQAFGPAVSANVVIRYQERDGGKYVTSQQRLIDNGAPGDGAVRSTTTVAVYDSDRLYGTPFAVSPGRFYAPEGRHSGGDLYTVLQVEVIVWSA